MSTKIGIIVTVNKKGELSRATGKHGDRLEALGYTVTKHEGFVEVECTGFVKSVDLSEDADALKKVVKEKKLLTYSTVVTLADGEVKSGVMACGPLGAASCLIAHDKVAFLKKQAAKAAKKSGLGIESLLS